jgi:hypothetical protein
MKFSCNCSKPLFSNKSYSYWEDRDMTSDENDVLHKILLDKSVVNKKILHIGVGNSELAKKLDFSNIVTGITISKKEIDYGNSLKIKNYNILFCDKYSLKFKKKFQNNQFDLIIDTNLKSYACCQNGFIFMMDNFFRILRPNGKIITSIYGMKWFKSLKPKLSFNLKRFFYYKMKEVSGNPNNILQKSELKKICSLYGIKILFDQKLCYLIK